MRKYSLMFLTLSFLAGTEGCGNSESAPTAQSTSQTSATGSDQEISAVAKVFLEAIRSGNSANAAAQLTPLAQQRMRAADMDFELLASNSASYRVGRVEMLEANEAIVESVWIEPDAEGKPQQENWTLALQQANGKWGILGIVAETGINQPPVVMDFENPGQMAAPAETATAAAPKNTVPQQATRPAAQDPFRQ